MEYDIALLKGDGIGPEIVESACLVLRALGDNCGHRFRFSEYLIGGAAIDATGEPLPAATIEGCRASDSVLLGAVGGPKWDGLGAGKSPEAALLGIRSALGLYSNLRPVRQYRALRAASPLRADVVERGFDILIVRELTGGIYFGERGRRQSSEGMVAFDTECYSEREIERIGRVAFEAARLRLGRVVSVDKANVLESSRLWREVMHALAEEYPEVCLSDLLVDNAAMQLIRDPAQFDVLVTSNMFGDILSDEASQLTGSIGLLPSASLGTSKVGLYEPIHGSAPDLAGKDSANPIATILSAALMLRYSLGLEEEAKDIELAVETVLEAGHRSADIAEPEAPHPQAPLSCTALTEEIVKALRGKDELPRSKLRGMYPLRFNKGDL
jgi:3-isopropylmalate dehydrogenase